MTQRVSASLIAVILLAASGRAGEAPPRTAAEIYKDAFAGAQTLREIAASGEGALENYRAIYTAYDNLVRKFPQSGYADDALWQGGVLAGEAFDRFGQERDRANAKRMLRLLIDGYPYSPFVKRARGALQQVEKAEGPPTPAPPPSAAATGKTVVLRSIGRTALRDRVRVTLDLDGATTHRSERVEAPPRVLVDLRDTRPGDAVAIGTLTYKDSAASRVRIGLQPNHVTRVVISLDGVSRYRVSTTDRPYRIVVECDRADVLAAAPPEATTPIAPPRQAAQAPRPLASRPLGSLWGDAPLAEPIDAAVLHPPLETPRLVAPPRRPAATPPTLTAGPPKPLAPPAPAAPATGGRGPYSMTRQLGLGASKIVIDPGHGGHDPGALGSGVSEAEVVLDVSLRLEKLLKDAGVPVVLTRRTDAYVPLEERPAIAQREQADLFLSIHANASRARAARGVETYFLNFSTDPAAEEVAARENAATSRTITNLPDLLKAITLNNKLDESRSFAGLIQKAMARQLKGANAGVKDLGVKQAPFVVLIGAEMPSVLVEISFITNPQEGRLLKSGAYRQKIADALFDAVRSYQRSLKSEPASSRD